MSSQKGNTKRNRGQKHQNALRFKNTMHDTSKRTQAINGIVVDECCKRCTEVIEWKIKYKKYKLLTVPRKCMKCGEKAVKKAYYFVCSPCADKLKVCAKCGKKEDIVNPTVLSEAEMAKNQSQLELELKFLPERKRRAILRLQESGKLAEGGVPSEEVYDGRGDADDSDDPEELSESEDEAPASDDNEDPARDAEDADDLAELVEAKCAVADDHAYCQKLPDSQSDESADITVK